MCICKTVLKVYNITDVRGLVVVGHAVIEHLKLKISCDFIICLCSFDSKEL